MNQNRDMNAAKFYDTTKSLFAATYTFSYEIIIPVAISNVLTERTILTSFYCKCETREQKCLCIVHPITIPIFVTRHTTPPTYTHPLFLINSSLHRTCIFAIWQRYTCAKMLARLPPAPRRGVIVRRHSTQHVVTPKITKWTNSLTLSRYADRFTPTTRATSEESRRAVVQIAGQYGHEPR